MKIKLFFLLLSTLMTLQLSAQNKPDALDRKFKQLLSDWYAAVEQENFDWSKYYTKDACEIDPGGILICGMDNLIGNWKEMMKMVDEKPKFTYKYLSYRLITADVAIMFFDSNADVKIKGQQVGGPVKGAAVLRLVNGNWLVEFDSITPIVPMPDMK